MQWNQSTWYTRLLSIILFIGVIPVVAFFIGMQYQQVLNTFNAIPQAIDDYRLVHFTTQQQEFSSTNAPTPITTPTTESAQAPVDTRLHTGVNYSFTETGGSLISPYQYNIVFARDILGGYSGDLTISGFHLYYDWNVAVNLKPNGTAIVLYDSATAKSQGTSSFAPGDVLFTLVPVSTGYAIGWSALQPQVPQNATGSVFTPSS